MRNERASVGVAALLLSFLVSALALVGGGQARAQVPDNFGIEGGSGLAGGVDGLSERLHAQTKGASVIFLLSNSISATAVPKLGGNHFGHIAFAVWSATEGRYVVYTANQNSKPGGAALFFRMPLEEYLYAVKYPEDAVFGSNFGVAFARDTVGVAVAGTSQRESELATAEFKKIEAEFAAGTLTYSWRENNCARLTQRVIQAAGVTSTVRKIPLPLDVMSDALRYAEAAPHLEPFVVDFERVPGSKSTWRQYAALSLYDVLGSLLRVTGLARRLTGKSATIRVTTAPEHPMALGFDAPPLEAKVTACGATAGALAP